MNDIMLLAKALDRQIHISEEQYSDMLWCVWALDSVKGKLKWMKSRNGARYREICKKYKLNKLKLMLFDMWRIRGLVVVDF